MIRKPKQNLRQRVIEAAERCLDGDGAVGILDVFMYVRFLELVHFEAWKKGMNYIPVLEEWIQCGEDKRKKASEHFLAWVHEQKLEPFDITFQQIGRHGSSPLRLTKDGDESREALYCTKFRAANLTPAKKERVEKKANKVPDLLVYVPTGDASECAECQESLEGELLYLENGVALCMECADMAHLVFLPSGNATLTRRARKNSALSAVVLRFNRRRKRYERQGILVTQEAIEQAEDSCEADSEQRAKQREKAAERRVELDSKLVEDMTKLILVDYPACPLDEANRIATHTAERGSGRVGRSAAGRALSANAIRLAVRAWIRHQHTNYDSLLMQGVERMDAREQIDVELNEKLRAWQADD